MPFSLLVAIFLAFGFDVGGTQAPLTPDDLRNRILETALGALGVGAFALLLGEALAFRVARDGGPSPSTRRLFTRIGRVIELLSLLVYGWTLYWVDWPGAVEWGMNLRDTILVDEFLILLPFLAAQFLVWWGLYPAERALRADQHGSGRGRYLVMRARQALGLVLPVALVFSLGKDLLVRLLPQTAWVNIGWMAVVGALVMVLAPAFVRLTWPTRPLPPGPLRDRLERLSRRFHFRCTDILVWDTGQALVNAGVTGALPWFRYVLLTDALVENLSPHQVEAVFGHEVGHIAHRHLSFFGLFFLGSVGVAALVVQMQELIGTSGIARWVPEQLGAGSSTVMMVGEAAVVLGFLALYFLVVFGFLSRRFERQADIFGCRAVSCGRSPCPPHADLNGSFGGEAAASGLCPAGIRIFASALDEVAALNGMERESRWAWRHGSIASRIAFIEALDGHPEAEQQFQRRVHWLRLGLAVALASAMILAAQTNALELLH